MTIHLQGIGQNEAIKAKDIKPGDVLKWNYGYTSQVVEIIKETPKQIIVKTVASGETYERRFNKERLVGIAR